jgi:hypothetical protein
MPVSHGARLLSMDGDANATIEGMRRMGKDQQLVRHFRLLSITSFVAIATAAWEIGLFVISPGLIDGGRSGLIWNTICMDAPKFNIMWIISDFALPKQGTSSVWILRDSVLIGFSLTLPFPANRFWPNIPLNGRDGIHGSHSWGAIPLG